MEDIKMGCATEARCGCRPGTFLCRDAVALWTMVDAAYCKAQTSPMAYRLYCEARDVYQAHWKDVMHQCGLERHISPPIYDEIYYEAKCLMDGGAGRGIAW